MNTESTTEEARGYDEGRLTEVEEEMVRCGRVSPEEARDILVRFCHSHFRGRQGDNAREAARISIPADPSRDDDLRLSAFIEQAALAMKAREEIREEAVLEERGRILAILKERGFIVNLGDEPPRKFMILGAALAEVKRLKAKLRDVHSRLQTVGLLTNELDLQ